MPIFFQQQINESTRLGIWKIEETEEFFKGNVPLHRDVTHPHKRLQHLAGRFLLQFLFPDFPYHLIEIADTRKPFLPNEQYHFSISHCGDYAAAIVSRKNRVGIDIEIPTEKILKISKKFLNEKEDSIFNRQHSTINDRLTTQDSRLRTPNPISIGSELLTPDSRLLTLFWSAKESVFKWYGDGGVDFRKHILLLKNDEATETIDCFFLKDESELKIHYRQFEHLVLAWVVS
ncbi:MAG: 4'-phosphopantetheinyl transferase superfamily protein [Chitinophagaceae bacterium]|nr:4'-phosphopantetheinyl transferase superfamily protein [Chitinophagaceae bacterium]